MLKVFETRTVSSPWLRLSVEFMGVSGFCGMFLAVCDSDQVGSHGCENHVTYSQFTLIFENTEFDM